MADIQLEGKPTPARSDATAARVKYGTEAPVTGSTMAMGGSLPTAVPSTTTVNAPAVAGAAARAGGCHRTPGGVVSVQRRADASQTAPQPAARSAASSAGTGTQLPSSRGVGRVTGGAAVATGPNPTDAASAAAAQRVRSLHRRMSLRQGRERSIL